MKIKTYERETLYKEVWAEPMTTVCKRYGISDVALRKHCKKLEIPLPPSGYWAKVKAGHKVKIPPLPKSKGPEKIVVMDSPKQASSNSSGSKMSDTLLFLPDDQRKAVKDYCSYINVPNELSQYHGLIKDTKQYFRSRKESTKPPVNRVLNIDVSNEQKGRVYRIFTVLFKALEHLGYTVEIKAPKSERYLNYEQRVYDNVIYICLGNDGVPIFIKEKQHRVEHKPTLEELEKQKRYSWASIPPYDLVRNGKLVFTIDEYHAKRKNWRDNDKQGLEDQIGEIVIWIMEAIQVVKSMREEREAERVRWLKEERKLQQLAEMRKREKEHLELLEQHASDWERAQQIRRFLESVELKASEIRDTVEKEKVLKWLKWARGKADWLDPLTEKTDDGKSSYLFYLINNMDF